jgi:hypothetical protein
MEIRGWFQQSWANLSSARVQKQNIIVIAGLTSIAMFQAGYQIGSPVAFIEMFELQGVSPEQIRGMGTFSLGIGFGLIFLTGYYYRLRTQFSIRYYIGGFVFSCLGVFIGINIPFIILTGVFLIGIAMNARIEDLERFNSIMFFQNR